jgi:hypothetical protein
VALQMQHGGARLVIPTADLLKIKARDGGIGGPGLAGRVLPVAFYYQIEPVIAFITASVSRLLASNLPDRVDQATDLVLAIEEGLPLARAASGGVSGIFDAYGRTIVATKLDGGAVEAPLPEALPPTFFARFGAVSTPILLILVLALRFGLPRTPGRGFRS